MEILDRVKAWSGKLAEVGVSVAALMIILEVLVAIFFLTTPAMVAYMAYQDMVEYDNEEKFW